MNTGLSPGAPVLPAPGKAVGSVSQKRALAAYMPLFAALKPALSPRDEALLSSIEAGTEYVGRMARAGHYMAQTGVKIPKGFVMPYLDETQPDVEAIYQDPKTLMRIKELHRLHPDDGRIARHYGQLLENSIKRETDILEVQGGEGIADLDVLDDKLYSRDEGQRSLDRLLKVIGQADAGAPLEVFSLVGGHPMRALGDVAQKSLALTETAFQEGVRMILASKRLEHDEDAKPGEKVQSAFEDIDYYFETPCKFEKQHPGFKPLPLAEKTFDIMGLGWHKLVKTTPPPEDARYSQAILDYLFKPETPEQPILINILPDEHGESNGNVAPLAFSQRVVANVEPQKTLLNDVKTTLHELGHALHFAYTQPETSYAINYMTNNTVAETFALLMEHLTQNQDWLQNVAGLKPKVAAEFAGYGAIQALRAFRGYGVKVRFQTALLDGTPLGDKPQRLFVSAMKKRTGEHTTHMQWPAYVNLDYTDAGYYMSYLLEAQLRKHLQQNYGGETWYRNPKAMMFVKSLWHEGNMTVNELAKRINAGDPYSPNFVAPLIEQSTALIATGNARPRQARKGPVSGKKNEPGEGS